jgi:hypothetical protein
MTPMQAAQSVGLRRPALRPGGALFGYAVVWGDTIRLRREREAAT